MPNIQTILLFVFTSGQICGSQIFGGQGPQGHGHGVPPPRGEFFIFLHLHFHGDMLLFLRRAERLARLLAKHELRPILTCRTRNSATVRDLHFRWSQLAPATVTLLYT